MTLELSADKFGMFQVPFDDCVCDMRELECLPSADCLRGALSVEDGKILQGIHLRKLFKEGIRKWYHSSTKELDPFGSNAPLGKVLQFHAIRDWRLWSKRHVVSEGFGLDIYSSYLDLERFGCVEKALAGTNCFWRAWNTEQEDLGEIETSALSKVSQAELANAEQEAVNVYAEWEYFRKRLAYPKPLKRRAPAPHALLSFATVLRIQFHRQPTLVAAYQKHYVVLNPDVGSLRVALHLRRGDACGDRLMVSSISTMAGGPQMTNRRVCYKTRVYVDLLTRIQKQYEVPLAVYISSDTTSDILQEIQTDYPALFRAASWHYLNYSRAEFKYNEVQIEMAPEQTKYFLGESAVADVWHLSHGQIYVGHMGSRFGKVAYHLAVARHNRVVPWITVDGHSLCCEIDEHCANATRVLRGMPDCLGYVATMAEQEGHPVNWRNAYWTQGATNRWDRGPARSAPKELAPWE